MNLFDDCNVTSIYSHVVYNCLLPTSRRRRLVIVYNLLSLCYRWWQCCRRYITARGLTRKHLTYDCKYSATGRAVVFITILPVAGMRRLHRIIITRATCNLPGCIIFLVCTQAHNKKLPYYTAELYVLSILTAEQQFLSQVYIILLWNKCILRLH